MSKTQVSVEVEKEAYEVMQGIAKFVKAVKEAHAGGANLAVAIPQDVAAAVADLAPVVGELGALKGDLEESKVAFAKAMMIGAADVAAVFI